MLPSARSGAGEGFTFSPPRKSISVLWVFFLVGTGLFAFFACGCGCGVGAYFLFRDDFTDTTWRGSEQLLGFGPLTFEFKQKGVAVMTDAKRVVKGTWTRNGSRVTIRFANCEYRGTIDGKVMTGTATGFGFGFRGLDGVAWPFEVTRV